MYVCVCNAVTDRDIKKAVAQGHDTFDKVSCQLKVGSCCGRCQFMARQIIDEAQQEQTILPATELGVAFA
ncbi:(2Fe-2S)-binding protein [Thiofilum flexile]|uniref:(2Fe-2S)-binding protein n=1 Tax=Thiofilum flexile TaxID=125627 RepID=UPI00037F8E82|nr:(2Fe-2S)-binding protein [Thiofilum flexile]